MSPRLATATPITEPPLKAINKAAPCPLSLAAAVVRTLARVADFMPRKPASTEQAAPPRNAAQVGPGIFQASRPATTATNTTRIVYSRRRNAIAPVWIASASSRILSLPSLARRMLKYRIPAKIIPAPPR